MEFTIPEWFELKKHAFYAYGKFKGRNIHLIKPSNFVNNSGKAVKYWSNELKINLDNILVITDDLSLPYGKIRLKKKLILNLMFLKIMINL